MQEVTRTNEIDQTRQHSTSYTKVRNVNQINANAGEGPSTDKRTQIEKISVRF